MNLDEQLRRHDPARDITGDLSRTPHARATLTRIIAGAPGGAPGAAKRKGGRKRYVLAAVAATVGVIYAPILGAASATAWDADPVPATSEQVAKYARDCAEWTGVGATGGYRPEVVEVRGEWVMTYLTTADGEAHCLKSTKITADYPEGQGQALSGPLLPAAAADALATTGVMETSEDFGGLRQYLVSGTVGSRVTGVVFEAQGTTVRATVNDGRFTAWWPQREPNNLYGRLVNYTGWNGSPNPTVVLTLDDGSTITNPVREYDVNH